MPRALAGVVPAGKATAMATEYTVRKATWAPPGGGTPKALYTVHGPGGYPAYVVPAEVIDGKAPAKGDLAMWLYGFEPAADAMAKAIALAA